MNQTKGHLHKRYRERQDLAGENKFGDAGQLILLIIFIAGVCADKLWLHFSDFLAEYIPLYVRIIIALPLLGFSYFFSKDGLKKIFRDKREKLEVVDKGVFGLVRHPIYTGSMLLYKTVIVLTLSIIGLIIFIFIALFYYYISRYEEKLLTEKLGEEYLSYKKRVPMFIPWIKF